MALSPMMRHYFEIKENHKDCIVLYRLGDFFEMFFDDAILASKILELTLTGRDCGLEKRAPMCGVPYHAVESYIFKLIESGQKVAICEQKTSAEEAKGAMIEREVIRIITPGTLIEENLLNDKVNNYIASIAYGEKNIGISWCDISTGQFELQEIECSIDKLLDVLLLLNPSEIISNKIVSDISKEIPFVINGELPKFQPYYEWSYDFPHAYKSLCAQFNVQNLYSFECVDKKMAISAAGALIDYLHETQKRELQHINNMHYLKSSSYMLLDKNATRNLELFTTMRDGKKYGSLSWVLDSTKTSMGARLLNKWISQPLYLANEINERLDSVEELISNDIVRDNISESLNKIRDIERLASKIVYLTVTPKDCLAIKQSLRILPSIKENLDKLKAPLIVSINNKIDPLVNLCSLLEASIDENCPMLIKDGNYIKEGYNKELDSLRNIYKTAKVWLANIEASEREMTGIKNLKINYNRVFGYYIEVSKSNTNLVPLRYQRRQTTSNSERYFTPELKEIEEKILSADDKAQKLELLLYSAIREQLLSAVPKLKANSIAIATIDVLTSFANTSINNAYSKPIINANIKSIEIEEGRHPVVEKLLRNDQFISNDAFLDNKTNRTMIITGPNMAGKSTYMRQVALITLMAHVGCFVPAKKAKISLTDRIFTRVGASDDLGYGQSTFMVEMTEVATILKNATENSLLILDEIGRGTSTYDGLSIAWSVMEYICNILKAKTLFATHYHELTELEGLLENVHNYRILVKEINDSVIFLHKIARGGANRSFGIEVAALAGVPQVVTKRAKEILGKLEKNNLVNDTNSIMINGLGINNNSTQLSFVSGETNNKILEIIKKIDINNCTPLKALEIISDLIEKSKVIG